MLQSYSIINFIFLLVIQYRKNFTVLKYIVLGMQYEIRVLVFNYLLSTRSTHYERLWGLFVNILTESDINEKDNRWKGRSENVMDEACRKIDDVSAYGISLFLVLTESGGDVPQQQDHHLSFSSKKKY